MCAVRQRRPPALNPSSRIQPEAIPSEEVFQQQERHLYFRGTKVRGNHPAPISVFHIGRNVEVQF
jgi:hypothetical protein